MARRWVEVVSCDGCGSEGDDVMRQGEREYGPRADSCDNCFDRWVDGRDVFND